MDAVKCVAKLIVCLILGAITLSVIVLAGGVTIYDGFKYGSWKQSFREYSSVIQDLVGSLKKVVSV